jgi:DNA-binding IclR family transcriptional regulator
MPRETSPAPALERGLDLLNILSDRFRHGAKAQDLLDALKLPRASLFRLLKVLYERNLVQQSPTTGLYNLGVGAIALGFSARSHLPLLLAAQPILRDVARATHQMTEIGVVVSSWQAMFLDVWQTEGAPIEVLARAGLFFAIRHNTAPGMCWLTFDGERRLAEYMRHAASKENWHELSIRSAPPADLPQVCARWKKLGYTYGPEGGRAFNSRVVAPVFNPHSRTPRLAATLHIACSTKDLTAPRAAKWGMTLCHFARELEKKL